MKPLKLNLTTQDTRELQRLFKRSDNWRIRERVESLLLLVTGISCSQVAEKIGLSRQTIETTRRAWFDEKFESLPDKLRPGAPRKIKSEE
jgi:transposase